MTDEIELYFSPTANCQRVLLALRMMALPHRVILVDRAGGETRSPDFLRLNPAGAVPVIVQRRPERDMVLSQSGAILIHLAEHSGRFLPASGLERVEVLRWLMQVLTDVNPAASMDFLARAGIIDGIGAETAAFLRHRFERFLMVCEERLADAPWLADEPSVADIALYPLIPPNRGPLGIDSRFPALADWFARFGMLPGVAGLFAEPGLTGHSSNPSSIA